MNCKDCIHYEICKFVSTTDKTCWAEGCEDFTSKNKIIDLPCNIGDTVWFLEYEDERPVSYSGAIFLMANNDFVLLSATIDGMENVVDICNEHFDEYCKYQDGLDSCYLFPLSEIFFTKEEAKKALKENKFK